MKKIIEIIILFVAATLSAAAQTKGQSKIAGDYTYKTECMGVEGDGSQTVKAYGFGNSKNDAVEQAKKNAVRDVLFSGIQGGKPGCEVKPLLNEPNIREKNEDYFNLFFKDGGEYLVFVSMNDMPVAIVTKGKDRKAGESGVTYGMIVTVKRPELKRKMIADKILVIP